MSISKVSEGIYRYKGKYYTLNRFPGTTHHGEQTIEDNSKEYRHWDPYRSKLGSFLKKTGYLPITDETCILYLGAGDGTTVSYLSDVIRSGNIYAVEFSSRPYQNLLELSYLRNNVFPILADAREPENYSDMVPKVDVLYQDIAQRDQGEIFVGNLKYLKKGGTTMLAVKSRSIDVSQRPKEIYQKTEKILKKSGIEIIDFVDIGRWQKDHGIFLGKKE